MNNLRVLQKPDPSAHLAQLIEKHVPALKIFDSSKFPEEKARVMRVMADVVQERVVDTVAVFEKSRSPQQLVEEINREIINASLASKDVEVEDVIRIVQKCGVRETERADARNRKILEGEGGALGAAMNISLVYGELPNAIELRLAPFLKGMSANEIIRKIRTANDIVGVDEIGDKKELARLAFFAKEIVSIINGEMELWNLPAQLEVVTEFRKSGKGKVEVINKLDNARAHYKEMERIKIDCEMLLNKVAGDL